MKRIKLIISYDGSGFSGWQVQPDARSVQQDLETALSNLLDEKISIFGAGRTDAGVHASGQVAHFDAAVCRVPPEKIPLALRGYLPSDIVVHSSEEVDSQFHACFGAVARVYRYRFVCGELFPFQRNYFAAFPFSFDIEKVQHILRGLVGTHDFSSFCLRNCDAKTKVREMRSIDVVVTPEGFDIIFVANGFLRKMIRMVTGSLLSVYPSESADRDMLEILEQQDNQFSGAPAVPGGLYLERVDYV